MKTVNKKVAIKEDFDTLVNNLKINNEDFNITFSSSKILIENENLKYSYYPNPLKGKKGLYFIRKVKDYIEKNNITYNFTQRIGYNKINPLLKKSVNYKKDLFEVDLKAAYWYFAYLNGFISHELYKEGLKVDKKIRLVALGALAKNQQVFEYKKGVLIKDYEINSLLTEGIFFKVAFDTDMVMRKLIRSLENKDFMFYWVDAIFFRGAKNLIKIESILKKEELFYKVVDIKKLIRKENKFSVEDFDYKRRDFNFLKKVALYGKD